MSKEAEKERKDMVKTSITMARDLWEDVKIAAIRRGLTFTEVVQTALRKWLEIMEKERAERKEAEEAKRERVEVE